MSGITVHSSSKLEYLKLKSAAQISILMLCNDLGGCALLVSSVGGR